MNKIFKIFNSPPSGPLRLLGNSSVFNWKNKILAFLDLSSWSPETAIKRSDLSFLIDILISDGSSTNIFYYIILKIFFCVFWIDFGKLPTMFIFDWASVQSMHVPSKFFSSENGEIIWRLIWNSLMIGYLEHVESFIRENIPESPFWGSFPVKFSTKT